MACKKYMTIGFFRIVNNEEKARELIWRSKFGEKGFTSPHCKREE